MESFITGVLAGYGIAIPVGAIAVLIIQQGIRRELRSSIVAGAGAATADLVYATVAVVGGAALGELVRSSATQFRLISAIILIIIALVGLASLGRTDQPVTDLSTPQQRQLAATYGRFFALTIVNPATVAYFIAVVVGLSLAANLAGAEGALFIAGAFAASLSWQTLLAVVGSTAGKRLSRRAQTVATVVGNLLVFGFAGVILMR